MLNRYEIEGIALDSVELKALIVRRGVKIDKLVYQKLGKCRQDCLFFGSVGRQKS